MIAARMADQGWAGLLPVLPADAMPNVRLKPEGAAAVERGRGKAPGAWARAGWSLLSDWVNYPDDLDTVERWSSWPGVNVGLRACHTAAWVTFIDVDVLHHEAAAAILELLRRRLGHGDFIWRVGQAPKFMVPVRVTESVNRDRSTVVEIDGQTHMVEVLGRGQQAVVAGIHPKTGRPYAWPAGGLEDTEPGKLPLVTPGELAEILEACSAILLRHGKAVGRKGRSIRGAAATEPKPLAELRAHDPYLARSAAEFVHNDGWHYDDWVAWAYALRGAFGDDGEALWTRFSAQSGKHDPATAEKVWRDVTQAERDGHLRSGAGTILAVAENEGWTPPPTPGLPPYFNGGEQDPRSASAALRLAVVQWAEQGLAYDGKGEAPRDAIAAATGLGKTKVTLESLAAMAQGVTVHYYSPTLELGEEIVAAARGYGLKAAMIRGREANKKDPVRWPSQCLKEDVAAILARQGREIWGSLCSKEDEFGNVTTCEHFYGCPYVNQYKNLDGHVIVMAHEYLTLPKPLLPKPRLVVVDERFHTTLLRQPSLPLERVTAQRVPPKDGGHFRQLSHDARLAISAVEKGKTMAEIELTPERLRQMAEDEERLAEAPNIWPGMPYEEQKKRAKQLREIEAYRLAKIWRVLAHDHDRITQRVIVKRGIVWKGEIQDRVFIHAAAAVTINKHVPVLLLDADHDPLIGAATLPTNRRTVITAKINAIVTQVSNTACSKNKMMKSPTVRADGLALARHELAQGRRVLIITYKPVAELLRAELGVEPSISIVNFGAIRGLDGFKDYDSVIIAGREQPRILDAENIARALFGTDAEPLLFSDDWVPQMRGHNMKDGTRTAVRVQVHPDLRVQAIVEQMREREIEQGAGRLRFVHRTTPAHVFLLSNVPTALPVDRLAPWREIIPSKMERAIVAGRGVVPLSYSELARAHPGLWENELAARDWQHRKGKHIPIRDIIWNVLTLSRVALVSYRRLGQSRGSPYKAIVPGRTDPAAALVALLGPVEQVTVLETWYRPTVVIEDPGEPEPLIVPIAVHAPYHLIDVAEAWTFGRHDTQRWTMATGDRVVVPVRVAAEYQLALRRPGQPTKFTDKKPP